jgi:hypothetical protein
LGFRVIDITYSSWRIVVENGRVVDVVIEVSQRNFAGSVEGFENSGSDCVGVKITCTLTCGASIWKVHHEAHFSQHPVRSATSSVHQAGLAMVKQGAGRRDSCKERNMNSEKKRYKDIEKDRHKNRDRNRDKNRHMNRDKDSRSMRINP